MLIYIKRRQERGKNRCASNVTNKVKGDAMSTVGSDVISIMKNK